MSEAPVRPAGWRILVEPVEIKRETAGGIALPEESVQAQEYKRYSGEVVAMGHLCYRHDKFKPHPNADPIPWCKVGDVVAFDKHAGQEIVQKTDDGKEKRYRIINDDNVLAVVTDEASIVTPM
jgi:co-chaperonin GroES (HSP10)